VSAVIDYRDLLGKVDAVSVATPPRQHYEVARAFLESGAHVLVEKPITADLDQANSLIGIARDRQRVLQVGHLERFSAAERVIRRAISRPIYIETSRIGPFPTRGTEINAVLDLMIHDLDLILGFVNSPIGWVHAVGAPVFSSAEDIASSRIQFANGCVANLTVSRISLRQERKMKIFQADSYVSVDFLKKRVKLLRRGSNGRFLDGANLEAEEIDYSDVDILELELEAFLGCVRTGKPPAVSGEDGRRALEAALMITRSLQSHWRALDPPPHALLHSAALRAVGHA
jgi:predicted dehydrogenase